VALSFDLAIPILLAFCVFEGGIFISDGVRDYDICLSAPKGLLYTNFSVFFSGYACWYENASFFLL
jgi:hypothetical protein